MVTADGNVFVYAFDDRDPLKQRVAVHAIESLRQRGQPVALQVIGDFHNVARRKLKMATDEAAAIAFDLLDGYRTLAYADLTVRRALGLSAQVRLSLWEAVLVVSAVETGCTAILSEDMQDGSTVFGLEIVNPFGPDGLSARAADLLAAA